MKAGITKRVHPHGFRHTHAAELASDGVHVSIIRRQLGHIDLAETQRYIDHLAPVDVISRMQQREWPGVVRSAPVSRAVTSQGAAVHPEAAIPEVPERLERPLPALSDALPADVFALLGRNGGRATSEQLAEALEMPPASIDDLCTRLAASGELEGRELRTPRGSVGYWQQARSVGVATTTRRIIELLAEREELTERDIADALSIRGGTVNRHCRALETAGRLTRSKQPTADHPRNLWRLSGNPSEDSQVVAVSTLMRSLGAARSGAELRPLILRLVRENGGRATQRQLSQALRVRPATIQRQCEQLATAGQLSRAGYAYVRGAHATTNVWVLPPLAAIYGAPGEVQVAELTLRAPRGGGQQRILEAIRASDGRASQAQLAGKYGLSTDTVAKHCKALEARGLLERGGLDKSTSNRGSQIWRLRSSARWHHPTGATLTFTHGSSTSSNGRSDDRR